MEQHHTDTYGPDDLETDRWGRGALEFPEMNHAGGGVDSRYDPVIAREILRLVLEGQTVKEIAEDPDLPSYSTIYVWVRRHADFRWRWRAARRHLAEGRVNTIDLTHRSKRAWNVLKATVDGGPVRGRGGRSTYNLKTARAFCRRLERGEAVSAICADPKMPSTKAVYGWLRREPAFRQMFVDARGQWLCWLEELQDEALYELSQGAPTAARVRAVRRRLAELDGRIGRLTPKTYRVGSLGEERRTR
jgi:transposase-like protein